MCKRPEEYKYSNSKKQYNGESGDYNFIEVNEDKDKEVSEVIEELLNVNNIEKEKVLLNRTKLKNIVMTLKDNYKISLRTIAKELGIKRELLRRIYNQ